MITIHKEPKIFQQWWHCQQICSKCTSLSSAWQIYYWLAHNSINFEFVYSLLLIPPIHEYSTVRKMQCSAFTGDKQFTNEQIPNIKFHLCPTFPYHIYPSSLLNLARLHTEKFLVLPTKSWNDTNTCSKFTVFLDYKIRATVQLITYTAP